MFKFGQKIRTFGWGKKSPPRVFCIEFSEKSDRFLKGLRIRLRKVRDVARSGSQLFVDVVARSGSQLFVFYLRIPEKRSSREACIRMVPYCGRLETQSLET